MHIWKFISFLFILLVAVILRLAVDPSVGLAGPSGAVQSQNIITLTAVADATVKSWQPDTNFGGEDVLEISYSNIDVPREALLLLRFDVASALPSGAIIDSAELRLFLVDSAGVDPVGVAAHFVTSNWTESNVTWNSFPTAEPIGLVEQVDANVGSYKSWYITNFVQAWLSSSNNGIYLRRLEESYSERIFASREAIANLPQLVVTYHLPAQPDLIIDSFTYSGGDTIVLGGSVGSLIDLTIENAGSQDAGNFFVGFYISTDSEITTQDRLLIGGREFVGSLGAGQNTDVPLFSGANVPTDIPPGPAYLGVIIDEFDAISENDETNNTASIPVNLSTSLPLPSLRQTFRGSVYLGSPGEQSHPLWRAQVSLYGSMNPSELGEKLATNLTLDDGTFSLIALTDPDESFSHYFLAVNDPNYNTISVNPGPNGEIVQQHWIRFGQSDIETNDGNLFYVERSHTGIPMPTEPDVVPIWAGKSSSLTVLGPYLPPSDWPPPPPVTDVSILGVEVTQAIQCLDQSEGDTACPDNSLELTAGKTTYVRVYIGHTGGYSEEKCNESDGSDGLPGPYVLPNVEAKIELTWAAPLANLPPGVGWFGSKIIQPAYVLCSNNLKKLREYDYGSVTFVLGEELMGYKERSLWVQAEIIAESHQDSNKNNNIKEASLALVPRAPFTVKWIPIYYKPDPTPGFQYNGPPLASSEAMREYWFMETMYPSPVQYVREPGWFLYGSLPGWPCPTWGKDNETTCPDIRANCAASLGGFINCPLLYKLESFRYHMMPKPDALIGWVPEQARGNYQFYGIGGLNGAAFCLERSNSAQNQVCLAHEIGHTILGPGHINSQILEVGALSPGYPKGIIPGDTRHFMAEGGGDWISPATWNEMIQKSLSTKRSDRDIDNKAARLLVGANIEVQQIVLVGGHINNAGSAELDPLFYTVDEGPPYPVSDPDGDYCLDFQTVDGSTLASHCFTIEDNDATNTSSFFWGLPVITETKRIALRHNLTVLDEWVESSHAPDLEIIEPVVGFEVEDTLTVSWSANDMDGDPLQFTIRYSPNGGEAWTPIATGISETSINIEMNNANLAGGDNAQIQVIASDGFRTSIANSALFQVPGNPPDVWIDTSRDSSLQFHPQQAILLHGFASDLEDGELTGDSLTWTLEDYGIIGHGSQLILPGLTLSTGKHNITLSAIDSDGQNGTANIAIQVGFHQIYLPLILKDANSTTSPTPTPMPSVCAPFLVNTITVGEMPRGVSTDPMRNRVYVTNYGNNSISVIDNNTNTVIQTLTGITSANYLAQDPTRNIIWVTNYSSNQVTPIQANADATSFNILPAIDVGDGPWGVAYEPVYDYLYIVNQLENSVTIIDAENHTVIATLTDDFDQPYHIAANPITGKVYVTNFGNHSVTVIDGTTVSSLVDLYTSTQPYGIAVDEIRDLVYVSTVDSHRIVVLGTLNEVSDQLLGFAEFHRGFGDSNRPVPLRHIAINPDIGPSGDGGHLWTTTSTADGSEANEVLLVPKGWGGYFSYPVPYDLGSVPVEGIAIDRVQNRIYVSSSGIVSGTTTTPGTITVLGDSTDPCVIPFRTNEGIGFELSTTP